MELGLCPVPALGRAGRVGRLAPDLGRSRADRRLAAYDRQHHRPGPQSGRRRKRGTHKEGFGRSRGGFTSKIHARADGQGRPLGFVLTGGETSDYEAVPDLFDFDVAKPRLMLADKGYDGDEVRQSLLVHGILPVIPPRSNRREPVACDFQSYKDRNRIERMFNRMKQFRRIATRYDKTAKSFLAFLNLAAAKIWLPAFVNRT
ncbi:IS5 family transposase [Xanthobacter sp. VTT E-85241]|uniref:IS5 family transposase n=1 Tax=Roseixanthobacter finlandensis TaxID=3119922 RepID=UPI00372B469E